MIEPSQFDSEVFGLDVAIATVRSTEDVLALSQDIADFDAVWVTVKEAGLVASVCNIGEVGVVDYRYDFMKTDAGRALPWPQEMEAVRNVAQVAELIPQTFVGTRFYKDPRTAPHADRLYQAWLRNGVAEGRVMGFRSSSKLVGFLQWGSDPGGTGRILIAAVHPEQRGRGVFKAMMKASEEAFPEGTTVKGKAPVSIFGSVTGFISLGYRIHQLEAMVHLWL